MPIQPKCVFYDRSLSRFTYKLVSRRYIRQIECVLPPNLIVFVVPCAIEKKISLPERNEEKK